MNPLFCKPNQQATQFIIVGAGSLLKLPAKAFDGLPADDTKPALATQQHIPSLKNLCIATYARAGFKYIANHVANGFEYWRMNEPAPTMVKLNGGVL
jgi:hypothetical protein